MNWLTYITSVSSAIVVAVLAAFLNPRFQHAVWKEQKRREQRMEIAERFSTLHSRFIPVPAAAADSKWPFAGLVEEDALLVLIQVLFEREDTRASCNRLRKWLDTHGIQLTDGMPIGNFMGLWALRVDLLGRVFAEAYEISTDKLEKGVSSVSHKG